MHILQGVLNNTTASLFLIIAIGLFIGKAPIGKVKLGASGVLIAGLFFGHFGFLPPREIQTLGVILFVYAVGLNSGPHIVESFKKSKGYFFIMAFLIVATGGGLCVFYRYAFGMDPKLLAGIYAGALTSTPALAAAMETTGTSVPSIGYGLAYPLGILGVILMVQIIPPLFRVNLRAEEKAYRKSQNLQKIERKVFKVTNPNVTQRMIGECFSRSIGTFNIVRIKRCGRIFTPSVADSLELEDAVLVVGTREAMKNLKIMIGDYTSEEVEESKDSKSWWYVISSRKFIGKAMGNLEIASLYGVVISRVRRSGIEFVPNTNFVFEASDEVRVSGTPSDLERFAQIIEQDEDSLHETDLLSLALGLVFGVLIGLIKIPVTADVSVGLGIAGGPLVAGIILGYYGRFGILSGRMPKAAQVFMGELGLDLFLAVAGCYAGQHFMEIFQEQGISLILVGFSITVVPIVTMLLISRFIFRMNLLVALGMICGGMTSTPALGVLTSNTKSDVPALAYTGIYPIAVLLTTLAAQLLALS